MVYVLSRFDALVVVIPHKFADILTVGGAVPEVAAGALWGQRSEIHCSPRGCLSTRELLALFVFFGNGKGMLLHRRELLTPRDAAARWGVSRGHLANLRQKREGLGFSKIGGRVFYRLSDVLKFEDSTYIEVSA